MKKELKKIYLWTRMNSLLQKRERDKASLDLMNDEFKKRKWKTTEEFYKQGKEHSDSTVELRDSIKRTEKAIYDLQEEIEEWIKQKE